MNNSGTNLHGIDQQEILDSFQSLIALFSQDLDIKQVLLGYCQLVQSICKAELTGILLLDAEDKRLVQRKIYQGGDDWQKEDSFQVDRSGII